MKLTQRQSDVSQRLVEGMTIAAIADDLGLTESRVNQIIRALKNRFETDTQAGIVAAYQSYLLSDAQSADSDVDSKVGDESLVPEILNTPHPILYRIVAVCGAALMLALALFFVGVFASMMTDLADGRVRLATPEEAVR